MTNEEVFQRAHEEFALRGLSLHTADEYMRALRLFLRYYENRPIETMGEAEIRDFLLIRRSSGLQAQNVLCINISPISRALCLAACFL
jgi:site-specific recombinase XerD